MLGTCRVPTVLMRPTASGVAVLGQPRRRHTYDWEGGEQKPRDESEGSRATEGGHSSTHRHLAQLTQGEVPCPTIERERLLGQRKH
jgi:hypothetical protein